MNANEELLNFVYQNSQMGVETLSQILPMVKDEHFRTQIKAQLKEYQEINRESRGLLNENGCSEKEISALEKIMAYLMIDMKTLLDKSSAHISEMLIKGSNMGIIDAVKKIGRYEKEADKPVLSLMKRLLKTEELNVDKLKEYL